MNFTTKTVLLHLTLFAFGMKVGHSSPPQSDRGRKDNEEIEIPRALKESVASNSPASSAAFGFGKVDTQQIKRNLCPGVTQNLEQFRYDARAGKCSRVGQQSHCGENMAFYGVTHNELYGECDCLYNSLRPLIYHAQTKRCYFVYEQAYCRKGEWLSFQRDGKAGCGFNKCQTPTLSSAPSRAKVYVPLNGDGSCVVLGQRSDACKNEDQIVSFILGELTPKCVKPEPGTRGLALSRQLKCRAGTYLNIVGRCQPPFNW